MPNSARCFFLSCFSTSALAMLDVVAPLAAAKEDALSLEVLITASPSPAERSLAGEI